MPFRWFPAPNLRRGASVLDWWSIPHLLAGCALAAVFGGWLVTLSLLVAYELFEGLLRRIKTKEGAGVFEYESWPNVFADVVIGMLGWGLVHGAMTTMGLTPLAPFAVVGRIT